MVVCFVRPQQVEKGRETQSGLRVMDNHSLSYESSVKTEIAGCGNGGNVEAEYAAAAAAALAKGQKRCVPATAL